MPVRLSVLLVVAGWVIVVAGWVITHMLSLRAQRRQFLNNVMDAARKEVVKAIRLQQAWSTAVGTYLFALKHIASRAPDSASSFWRDEASKLHAILFADNGNLTTTLEEYENLFPQTTICRGELSKVMMSLTVRATEVAEDLTDDARRPEAITRARESVLKEGETLNMLLDDLRVHIQNFALEKITGREAKPRRVDGRPRILPDAKGILRIQP